LPRCLRDDKDERLCVNLRPETEIQAGQLVSKISLIFKIAILLFGASCLRSEIDNVSPVPSQNLAELSTATPSHYGNTNTSVGVSQKIARSLKRFDPWTPVLFWVASFIAAMFFVPVTVAAVLSGMLFGKLSGTWLLTTSVTAASMTAFLIGRGVDLRFRSWYSKHTRIQRWMDTLENLFQKNGFTAVFILRNIPHPFILVSYLAGLIRTAGVWSFGAATFACLLLRGFAFVYLGESLMKGPQALILPIVLITVCIVMSFAINKRMATKG
jgi:uncharacterized membrane protein YdjX (TVP38/TMEM64 family)